MIDQSLGTRILDVFLPEKENSKPAQRRMEILTIDRTLIYKACSNADCNEEVERLTDGAYTCGKCSNSSPFFKWKIRLNITLRDDENRVFACTAFKVNDAWEEQSLIFDGFSKRRFF